MNYNVTISENKVSVWQGLTPRAEVAAQALVQLLARELSVPSSASQVRVETGSQISGPVRARDSTPQGEADQKTMRFINYPYILHYNIKTMV